MFRDKRVVVTGCAGFIGSNICKTLVDLNADVYCLDNLSTGHKSNIECLINRKNFKFLQGDITDLKTCQFSCQNMDFVLHQAALGSVPRSIKDPLTTNNVNITGFLNMLISSRDNNIKRFIFAASSSTYGDSKSLPKLENIINHCLYMQQQNM